MESEQMTGLREQLAHTERQLRQAEENMQRARAEQRRQALTEMGGASEIMRLAQADTERAQKAFDEADAAVQAAVYRGMQPEEAARRTEKDYKAAKELLRLAGKLPPAKLAFIPLGLCVPAFAAALFLPWKLPCVGVGSILLLLFVVTYPRLRELARTKQETLDTRQKILDAYGVTDPEEIPPLLEQYRQLWQQRERAQIRLEDASSALDGARRVRDKIGSTAVSTLDFVNGSSAAAQAGRELQDLRAEKTRLQEQLAALAAEETQV